MVNINKLTGLSGNTFEKRGKNMKYTIRYSVPYDIHRYMMDAKDEDQLLTFLKMLRDEQAYGFEVVPESTIAR